MDLFYKGEDIDYALQKEHKRGSNVENEDSSSVLKIPYYHKKPKIIKKTVRPKIFDDENNDGSPKCESPRLKAIRNELRSMKSVYVKNRATSPDPEIFDINEMYALDVLVKRKNEEVYILEQALKEKDVLINEKEALLKLRENDLAIARMDFERMLTKMAESKLCEATFNYEENSLKKNLIELQKEIGKLELLLEKKDEEIYIYKHKAERVSEEGKNIENQFDEHSKEMEKKNKESLNLFFLYVLIIFCLKL